MTFESLTGRVLLERILATLEDALSWMARLSLQILLGLMLAQVIARYFFNQPLGEVITLTETYLMPALVFFGLATVQRHREHVRVDILYARFRGRPKQIIDICIWIVSAAYWALIAYCGAQEAHFSWEMGYELSKDLPVPVASALVIVPIGTIILALRLFTEALKGMAHLGRSDDEERF